MDLNELDQFIGKVNSVSGAVLKVQANIQKQSESFLNNERQTRSGLIDPILRILGWNVGQVDLVGEEYPTTSSGTADYALFRGSGTDPVALIEAKRLSKSWNAGIAEQLANYTSNENAVRFAIFTNGDHWRMRETGRTGTVIDIHLSKESPLKSALELMRLERNILLNNRIEKASPGSDNGGGKPHGGPRKRRPNSTSGSWHSLAERAFVPTRKRATAVRLRGEGIETRDFTQAAVKIADWLSNEGLLTRDHCPKKLHPTGQKYFIALEPIHEDGKEFKSPKELSNGMVMEANASSSTRLMCVRDLVELCGVSSEEVSIKWVERTSKQ